MHDPAANAKRVQFYGLDGQDYANFPRILSVVSKSAPKALDLFYKKIAATPEVSGFFTSKTVMDHARDKQLDHWSQLFSRELGAGYFEKAEQIGNVHARIGYGRRRHDLGRERSERCGRILRGPRLQQPRELDGCSAGRRNRSGRCR